MVAPRTYLRVARQFWWLIVAGLIIGVGLGALAHRALPATYEATNLVVVKPGDAESLSDLSGATTLVTATANNLAALGTADPVLAEIAERADVPRDEVTAKTIEITLPSNTAMLAIKATSSDPQRAALLANAAGEVLATRLAVISPQGGGQQIMQLGQVAPASPPAESSTLPRVLLLLAGAVAGAAIGFIIGLLRLTVGARLRDENAVADATDSPILGTVDAATYPFNGRSKDQFAVLMRRTGVLDGDSSTCRTLAVIPVDRGGSPTPIALGLADAAAAAGRRVLLIEGADGAVPNAPWSESAPGLSEVLGASLDLTDALVSIPDSHVRALPYGGQGDDSGAPGQGSRALLNAPHSGDLRAELAREFDLIVIDTGYLSPDAAEVSFVDDAIVIAQLGVSRRKDLLGALSRVDEAQLHGIALTRGPRTGLVSRLRRNEGS